MRGWIPWCEYWSVDAAMRQQSFHPNYLMMMALPLCQFLLCRFCWCLCGKQATVHSFLISCSSSRSNGSGQATNLIVAKANVKNLFVFHKLFTNHGLHWSADTWMLTRRHGQQHCKLGAGQTAAQNRPPPWPNRSSIGKLPQLHLLTPMPSAQP